MNFVTEGELTMGIAFFALAVVLYLALVIDWEEMMGVVREGGWPAIAILFFLSLLITYIVACPAAMTAGGHH